MSTILDVRTAEEKLQAILEALKKAGADDPQNLTSASMTTLRLYVT